MSEYNFQKDLEKSMIEADPRLDKIELLTSIFKAYVAKMFEHTLIRKAEVGDDRLEFEAMHTIRRNLISEFRKAELGEYQRSVKWYEGTFETAMEEILTEAAHNHEGVDAASVDQRLEINKNSYINESGLYIPDHLKKD